MEIFVIERVQDEKGRPSGAINIGVKNPRDSSVVWISEKIVSQGEFENFVTEIKQELDRIVEEGNRIWLAIEKDRGGEKVLKPGMSPEDAWKVIESVDEGEMFGLFNNLPEKDRKAVANFVFTELNVFKGKAMYFSQHYDYASNLLVRG